MRATCMSRPPQPVASPAAWKWVAPPTSATRWPSRARAATRRARLQAPASRRLVTEPSQANENWHAAPARWNTTPQIDLGKPRWRVRLSTTCATAACPSAGSPRAS